uniref:Exocyst complex component Sec3 PIP2-binding N-terminal domain-containing protein n=1 Tax=Amphimedon queenslandica TaxID=400682 RepID=A0A1X7VCF4_AMPQE
MATSGGKAAVRLAIQKEVFTPAEERLLGLAAVSKPGRRKKTSYLCVSVYLSRIKQDDQRKDKQGLYRRVKKWELSELRLIDGKSADTEVPEFDLHFEKTTFKWVASNVVEKKAFVVCLYRMAHKYLPRNKPEFVHFDEERLHELLATAEAGGRGREIEEEAVQQEDYQELSEKEQEDLEKLLKEEEEKTGGQSGIQNIEAFTENLSQQLSNLDEANIHTLMDSETQIHTLMKSIDNTTIEIGQTELKLAVYDELLMDVRSNMSKLTKDYSRIMILDRNLKALLSQVEEIVEKLYLEPRVERILSSASFHDEQNIRECTESVKKLHNVMRQELSQGVQVMQAVTDQNAHFSRLSFSFGARLKDHLCTTFSQKSTLLLSELTQRSTSNLPSLSAHIPLHRDLRLYTELTHWMKECENSKFVEVCEAYCIEFQKVYDSEIKAFMADIKSHFSRTIDPRKGGGSPAIGGGALSKFAGSQADLSHRGSNLSLNSPSIRGMSASLLDFSMTSQTSLATPDPSKPRFDQVFMLVLEQLQPLCVSEEKFCTTFFHFPRQEESEGSSPPTSRRTEGDTEDGGRADEGVEEYDGSMRDFFGLMTKRNPDKSHMLDVGLMARGLVGFMQHLFGCLLKELESLIQFGEKVEPFNSLYLLVAVSQRVMFAQEGGKLSYLDNCLASSCVILKRLFNKLVTSREKAIKECKVPRKSGKCGVIPSVREFMRFAEKAESIVMGTDRRSELDQAYKTLINALFDCINRLSEEHPKTPRNVVLLENYYQVYDNLSQLKISCLDQEREEAKKRYRLHQQQYVITCLGKPLDKLSTFFEGVENLLGSGVKPEQIGFYSHYNKTELVKCIQSYPGKEVKKGLEKLYKRCDKDLSEESGRLRVVWGAMQEAFINQYDHFTKLMEKCYPGANMQLEFKLADIIEYFRSISDDK